MLLERKQQHEQRDNKLVGQLINVPVMVKDDSNKSLTNADETLSYFCQP